MLRVILTIVQVFASVAIIGLVLLQRGKGADAGAGFGAGASGTVFGARGATTALSRATAIFAAIFMINSLALAYMGGGSTAAQAPQTNTILDTVGQKANTSTPAAPQSVPAAPADSGATTAAPAPADSGATTAVPAPAPTAPAAAPAQPAPPK